MWRWSLDLILKVTLETLLCCKVCIWMWTFFSVLQRYRRNDLCATKFPAGRQHSIPHVFHDNQTKGAKKKFNTLAFSSMKRSKYLTITYSRPMKWVNIRRYNILTPTWQVNIWYYILTPGKQVNIWCYDILTPTKQVKIQCNNMFTAM